MNLDLPPDRLLRDVPAPKTRGLLGEFHTLRRNGFVKSYVEWWKQLGDAYRVRIGPRSLYMFAHPDHVRHIHVTGAHRYVKGIAYSRLKQLIGNGVVVSEGAPWRESRGRMQRLFLQGSVARHVRNIGECVASATERWERLADQREPMNVHQEFLPLTMQVITRCLLGSDLWRQAKELEPLLADAMAFVADSTFPLINLPLLLPFPRHRKFRRAMSELRDLIDSAMSLCDGNATSSPLQDALLGQDGDNSLTKSQIQAEVLNIVFAGYETTSLALTWAIFALASQPESMAKLAEEAARVIGSAIPSHEQVIQLNYARSVFEETNRLYPPVWAIARQAVEPDTVEGFRVPRGAIVLNCQFLTHRHPEFWDEPDVFRPERFLPDTAPRRHPFAYFPFGAGQRTCLGAQFATTEATVTLAMLAARFRFELCDEDPIEPVGRGTLYPHRPVRVKLSRI